jgi:hypothetical protein
MHLFLGLLGISLIQTLVQLLGPFLVFLGTLSQRKSLAASKQRLFEQQVLLSGTSAQDDFAKWAKLKRSIDSGHKAYAKSQESLKKAESWLSWSLWGLNWILTIGLMTWYIWTPILYVPPGLLGPFQSWLAWPLSPEHSIGIVYVLSSGASVFKRALSAPQVATSASSS